MQHAAASAAWPWDGHWARATHPAPLTPALPADPEAAGFGAEQRRHSALGIEQPPATDGFSVYADSSAKGTPAAAGSSCSGGGSSTSRRLSFSFGGGGLAFGCTESKVGWALVLSL